MAKTVHNDVLDAALNKIATATIQTICSAAPTTRTEAVTTYALADVTVDGADFTIADGDTNGRKVTCAQQTGVLVDATGTATHVAWCDAVILLYVTECTSQAVTAGNTATFNAVDIEMADPS